MRRAVVLCYFILFFYTKNSLLDSSLFHVSLAIQVLEYSSHFESKKQSHRNAVVFYVALKTYLSLKLTLKIRELISANNLFY